MFGPLGHLGAWLAYRARRGAREASDLTTATQLRAPPRLPPGLDVAWVGTAGFRLAYQGTVVWIDPYVTRLPLGRYLRRQVIAADGAVLAQVVDRADAVLVGHTHFDHALDVPALCARTGARAYGSASLAHLLGLHGQADRAVTVEAYQPYEIGPFRVTFVPSRHSRLAVGLWVPSAGDLTCEHLDELTPQAYRCGQVWGIHLEVAGTTIYHQGSADLLDDAIRHRGVDVFLCGIAGRRYTRNYVERILRRLEPRAIVPCHFDDFFQPLASPLAMSMNVNLTHFAEEVRRVSSDFAVSVLPRFPPEKSP